MVHLHARSCWSLLESPLRLEEYVKACKEAGQTHCVLSDHNTLYGLMPFRRLCKEYGLIPVYGLETEVRLPEGEARYVLLARNAEGLQELYRWSTNALFHPEENTFEAMQEMRNVVAIVLVFSDLASSPLENAAYEGDAEEFLTLADRFAGNFEHFYLGISLHDSSRQKEHSPWIHQLARQGGFACTAISQIHYLEPEDVESLRIMRAIAEQRPVRWQDTTVLNGRFFRTPEQMAELYDEEDLAATDAIMELIEPDIELPTTSLPTFENPLGIANDEYLQKLCQAGLRKRLHGKSDVSYENRLHYELSIILEMNFTDYFLIVYDFIRFARSRGIFIGPGRGSAAGSLVAWVLGITHIDPVANGLLFERFLNPERISMPDIDTDIPDDRRDEVVSYLAEKYGQEHVASIVTFSALKARQVLRDVGKALNLTEREISRLTKQVHGINATLKDTYASSLAFRSAVEGQKSFRTVYEAALKLEGLPRHTSVHAAGVVLSARPLLEVSALSPSQDVLPSVQWSMDYLEELGLIKMDLLSLRNLTIIDQVRRTIESQEGIRLDMLHLPLNDARTYRFLASGDTSGVFQLESEGIRSLLRQMHPRRFEDICAVIALYRPGPMKDVPAYLQARAHPESVRYPHPLLEPVLRETYGFFVYQEQVMESAQLLAGFSLGQADLLRKAMSKKKPEVLASYREQFVGGAREHQLDEKTASVIFDTISRFGGYAFNKSHTYAYGLIAYQTAFLKANFPLYFYQALLESVIGNADKTSLYISEARRCGLRVLPASVQHSREGVSVENGALRLPLTAIHGFGKVQAQAILEARPPEGFGDIYAFILEMSDKHLSQGQFDTLIGAGALDDFGLTRAVLRRNLPEMLRYISLALVDREQKLIDPNIVSRTKLAPAQESENARLNNELQAYGFYFSEHPVERLRKRWYPNLPNLNRILSGQGPVALVARVQSVRQHRDKRGQLMAFVEVEDESGSLSLTLFSSLFQQPEIQQRLVPGLYVYVEGRRDRRDSVAVNRLHFIDPK